MNFTKTSLLIGVTLAGSLTLISLSGSECRAHSLYASDSEQSFAPLLIAQKKKTLKVRIEHDVVQADDLMLKGKYSDAETMYKQALQRNTKSVPATVGYGMALAKQFKLDGAKQQFEKALQMDPRNAMAHAGLAMVMYNSLQSSSQTVRANQDAILKNAEAECKQGLAIDPGMPEAHYTLGNVYRTQGRMDEALSEYKEAARLDPEYSEAFVGAGLVQLNKDELADAVASFKQAIQLNSGNSTAHYGLGRTYFKQGLYDDALKELNISLYQHPNSAPVHLTFGEVYAAQGNAVAAVKEFNETIRIKPETPEAYINIADIKENRGDMEEAIAQLRSGTELMPDNSVLRGRIADLSLKLEKLDQAIKEYQRVLETDPGNGPAAQGLTRAYYMKANKEATSAFFVSNEFEQAKGMIENAVKMNPNNMELRLAQMKLRSMMGDPVDLTQVGNPSNDGERIAYAEALLAQNKFADADQQFTTVINNVKDQKETFAVADLALMIKDLKNAEAAYKKAATMPGGEQRAKRGLNLVSKAREEAKQELNLAADLAKKKQTTSAIDKYHTAIYENPRVAEARLGIGKTLEQVKPQQSKDLKEAVEQYKAYLSLSPELPVKEREKMEKKIESLKTKAFKLEQKEKQKGK